MMQFKRFACAMLALTSAGLVGYTVLAQAGHAGDPAQRHNTAADGRQIATQLDQNKMTLAKAVGAAEEHSKGRAISATTQIMHDQAALHVWCVVGDPASPPKIFKCHVDLATGKVAGMKEVHDFPIPEEQGNDHHPPAAHDPAHGAPGGHGNHGDPGPSGTGKPQAKAITNQTVEAACGVCIYKMPGVEGCPLAIKIDGKTYLVEGAKWPNHDYCDRNCQAIVSGRIEGDPPKFIATKFEPKQ
jgi:hypothetical protein